MMTNPDAPPKKTTVSWLLIFSFGWTFVGWLNTSLSENPVVFLILTGLLIQLALANLIVFVSLNRAWSCRIR